MIYCYHGEIKPDINMMCRNASVSVLPWLVMSCWYGVTPVGKASVAAVAAAL